MLAFPEPSKMVPGCFIRHALKLGAYDPHILCIPWYRRSFPPCSSRVSLPRFRGPPGIHPGNPFRCHRCTSSLGSRRHYARRRPTCGACVFLPVSLAPWIYKKTQNSKIYYGNTYLELIWHMHSGLRFIHSFINSTITVRAQRISYARFCLVIRCLLLQV